MKVQLLLVVTISSVFAGCATIPQSGGHSGTTQVTLHGADGSGFAGFYVQDGNRVAIAGHVPWTLAISGMSLLRIQSISGGEVSIDLRYDDGSIIAHARETLEVGSSMKVAVRNGFEVSTLRR